MKTDAEPIDERDQTKEQFERLGLFFDSGHAQHIKSSLVEYTKNWKQLSLGLILKQAIRFHTEWMEDEKMIINDDPKEDNGQTKKKKKSKQLILEKKNIPEEFQNDPELLKYWLQRYRLFSKYDEGIVLDRGETSLDLSHRNLLMNFASI